MRLNRYLVVAAGLLAFGSEPASAQRRWVDSRFPYIKTEANDFPVFAVRFQWTRPAEDYFSPLAYNGNLSLDLGVSPKGTYFATAQFRAPGLKDGWRLAATASAHREARFGFFGIGNDTEFDKDLVTDDQPFFYRMRRKEQELQAELTRRIVSDLYVAGAIGVKHTLLSDLPGPSVFRASFPREVEDTDLTGRISVIYDGRDNEFNTTRGLFLEAGVSTGTGGEGYRRVYAVAKGFLPIREGTVIGARIAGAGMSDDPPLHARFELPMWERTLIVFGGDDTQRALVKGRFAGKHVLFSNLEVRHNILDLGTIGALTAMAFVEAGRVFEDERFRLTTDDLKVGGGGGIAIRVLRSTIFTFNLASGVEGLNFVVSGGWSF